MNIFEKLLKKYEILISKLRVLFFKMMGSQVGSNVKIYGKIYVIGYYKNLTIGNNVTLNHGVILNLSEKITIGNNVRISNYVCLQTGKLMSNEVGKQTHVAYPIHIDDNAWIASGCVIDGGVRIGTGAVIGANSYVNNDIKARCMYAGSPAKFIRENQE